MAESDWTIDVWLVALSAEVDRDEVRRFWNVKGSPTLDGIVAESPSLWIGTSEPSLPENDGLRGPVGRVIDLLFLRGTTPDWTLPVLDEELETALLDEYQPQPSDPARFGSIPASDLGDFLLQHRGEHLIFRDVLLDPR